MNKALAEILAGIIPHKLTRNRWRGILRYGLLNAWKLRREIRRNTSEPAHYLAVCAIAKDEGPYFREWIEWHRNMGVEKFYIYDNGSTDDTTAILQPYVDSGLVELIPFPGQKMQLAAYDHCLAHHRYDTRWLAFIDIDEFIVPLSFPSIPVYLRGLEAYPAVEINWLIFGSNGLEEKDSRPVMERFTRHSLPDHPLNHHVKSIVNPRRIYNMIGCHEAARIDGHAVDADGRRVHTAWRDRPPTQQTIRINHYAVKSRREFTEKQARGRASGKQRPLEFSYFRQYDLNDLES